MNLVSLLNVAHQGPAFCSNLLPPSEHHSLYAALICGTDLSEGEPKRLFLDTGLIHIMVVSGAHLIFLERLTGWAPPRVRLLALGFYCWCTGFGAPVVKAFVRRVVERKLKPRGWTSIQCEAAAVLITLLFAPHWLTSRSFLMSWMCALAFTLPRFLPVLDSSAKVWVLLFAFSAASPLTILWNAILAPLVGEILFPACLLVIPLPFLTPLIDRLWDLLLWILSFGPQAEGQSWFWPARQLLWLPLFTHIFILMWEVRWRRALAFS